MQQDMFGQGVTLQSPQALSDWNSAMMAFLAHSAATPGHLGATLTQEPEFALGQAVKGLFTLLLGRRELYPTAREALALAEAAATGAAITPREQSYIHALAAYLDGFPMKSVQHLEEVLLNAPGDALAAKLSHAIRFVMGDAGGMRRSLEALMPSYGPGHPARGYILGCYAFALEETGDYARAETFGRRGLELCPDDAWGLHAVAHVYDMTANAQGGLTWLEGREAAWAHCNNFRYHVWWHKALMHLDLGDYDTALALYDAEIRADKTDDYRDISNGTSLLSRLELDGIDVGDRWEELADLSMARTEDGCLIFADLHYLLALIGGGREDAMSRMIARIHRDADDGQTEVDARFAHPGVSAAHGLEAFGEGDYTSAFSHLAAARATMQDAGGSHAQRDVFERLTIDAGLRAGLLDQAGAVLQERTAKRAGRNDGYAEARFEMIAKTRRIPAE